jgi:hypothetical protein
MYSIPCSLTLSPGMCAFALRNQSRFQRVTSSGEPGSNSEKQRCPKGEALHPSGIVYPRHPRSSELDRSAGEKNFRKSVTIMTL